MVLLGLATGNFYKFGWSLNETVSFIKTLGVSAVELTLATKEDVLNFNINSSNKNFLKSLNYLSIHAPFRYKFKDDDLSREVVDKLVNLYHDLSAVHIVIHTKDVDDFRVINPLLRLNISFENMDKKFNYSLTDYYSYNELYNVSWVLDTTHALSISKEHLNDITKLFLTMGLSQVHLSNYDEGNHKSILNCDSLIDDVKHLNVPIILERTYKDESLDEVKEEYYYLRNYLKE